MFKRILFINYILVIFCLFLYSFTQVDLNLTLSRASWFQTVEKSFQYIGYWQRPLSTTIFIGLVILLYGFYLFFLRLAVNQKITLKQVWLVVIIVTAILTFSYTAFSYDIFNYIFDAKIFVWYHQNPYLHKALDFPQDSMVHFMRWTHRTYPYGPFWLVLTIPVSFLGLKLFLPTFFLFKFLMAGSFLGTCYYIQKITQKMFPQNNIFSLVFFAFNPLVLIECLVSPHLDIVMLFFAMVAMWFLMNKKWWWAFGLLFFSIEIKFVTIFLLPVFLYVFFRRDTKSCVSTLFVIASVCMMIGIILESHTSGNFQPWYLLGVLPLASIVSRKYYIMIPGIILTFFALLEYAPYLYKGDWNQPVPTQLFQLTVSGIILSVIITVIAVLVLKGRTFARYVLNHEN